MMMLMVCLSVELNGPPIVDVPGCQEALGELLVPHFLALLVSLSMVGPTWLVASWPVNFLNPGMETCYSHPNASPVLLWKRLNCSKGYFFFLFFF